MPKILRKKTVAIFTEKCDEWYFPLQSSVGGPGCQ